MTEVKEIKTLLKEAQLYKTQGLLKEAKKRYEKAVALVEKNDALSGKTQLLEGIQKEIQSLDAVTYRVEKKTHITEISPRDKDLIKRLFSGASTDDKDTKILEGAVALAKFAQFDRAISEFEDLIEDSPLRIVAAKHILRCHMALRALHDPVHQFQKWLTTGHFGKEELSELSTFLERTYGLSVSEQAPATQPQAAAPAPPQAAPAQKQAPHPQVAAPAPPQAAPEQKQAPQPQVAASAPQQAASAQNQAPQPQVAAPAPPQAAPAQNQPPQPSKPPVEESSFDPYEDEYVDVIGSVGENNGKQSTAAPVDESEGYVDIIGEKKKKPTLKYDDIAGNDMEDYVDYISSVGIPIPGGEIATISVNLQTGSVANLIIPAEQSNVVAIMKKGERIENVKLNSPISTNTGSCIVVSVARIDMGPKKGDYSVDLKIES